jgi:hypothetical protein
MYKNMMKYDQKYLLNLIAKGPGHFYWKDKQGTYLGSNEAQAIFLGFKSSQDLIGKQILS